MLQLGYAISSEEHHPNDLIRYAKQAEETGFTFALISDHYHPWVSAQGHSPFVWGVIGGIAQTTRNLRLGTGVTCPTIRIHPAVIAQAAATAAAMMDGRFFLGVGTGENLNEHITGQRWPPYDIRSEMLEEAVDVMRTLWQGKNTTFRGDYYIVEDARIYTLPNNPLEIMLAASGPKAASLAGQLGDGLISTSPDTAVVQNFEEAGGKGKPRYGQITVCWANSEEEALDTVERLWPNSGLKGELSQELRTVTHFEQAAKMIKREDLAKSIICGPDADKHIKGIQEFVDAGFDHVYIHQIGPDQEGFFRFYSRQVMPRFA
jgi:G6PDH family F420-dependent oxidoreductase